MDIITSNRLIDVELTDCILKLHLLIVDISGTSEFTWKSEETFFVALEIFYEKCLLTCCKPTRCQDNPHLAMWKVERLIVLNVIGDSFWQELKAKSFNARKKFQLAILTVRACVRIKRLHTTPEPLSTLVAREDPYRIKVLRKVNTCFVIKIHPKNPYSSIKCF